MGKNGNYDVRAGTAVVEQKMKMMAVNAEKDLAFPDWAQVAGTVAR